MTKILTLAALLAMSLAAASFTHGQGYYAPVNQFGYNYGGDPFYQNIHQLNYYGNQMAFTYGQELRAYGGCRNSAALYAEMQRYNACSNNLMTAYHGTCPRAFQTASYNLCASYNRLQALSRCARVSPAVYGYMNSCQPMVTYLSANCSCWQPRVACAPHPIAIDNGAYIHRQDRGFDLKSAIIGAVAGRIIHGAIHRH